MKVKMLGRSTTERLAIMRNQATDLLMKGKLQTTVARAKSLKSYVEKLITLAMNTYEDKIEVTKLVKRDGKEVEIKTINDGPKRLAARRTLMAKLNDLQEPKKNDESKSEYKDRTKDVNHPLIEKMFGEIAPKYAERKAKLGQGGGYTRIYVLADRKGDGATKAIVELVD